VKPEDVEREIDEIRSRMAPKLDELSRRKERATDWKYQLAHRKTRIAKGVTVIGGLIAAVRWLKKRRERGGATA
jgi:hypothetical protein